MTKDQESSDAGKNWILAALPSEEYERLSPRLEPVELRHRRVLQERDVPIPYVYFPANAVISLISGVGGGDGGVEVGIIGREGMVGIHVLMGVATSHNESVVQVPGSGMRMKSETLREEFKRSGPLQDLLLRYLYGFMIQISQTAVCNRLHSIEERLARWLLMCHDRAQRNDLPLTHDFLAEMLGVRRAGVTGAAVSLQSEGFISYTRGRVRVTDRPGLEDFACECYAVVKAESERVFGR